MKRIIDIIILTSVLILSGCKDVSSVDPQIGAPESRPIEFGISSDLSVESKAAIDESNYTDFEFKPYGIFTAPGETSERSVFAEGTVVTYNPGASAGTSAWSYSPLRYWWPGSYAFAGVMPSVYAARFETNNETSILTLNFDNGFDLSTAQTDLLVAFDNETVTSASAAGPVDFDFAHQLALVTIEGKSKDPSTLEGGIAVNEITVYGNSKQTTGDIVFTYTLPVGETQGVITSAFTLGEPSTNDKPYKTIERPANLIGAAATADWQLTYAATPAYDVLVPELLVFPQTCEFSIVVKYTKGGNPMEITGKLPADWKAGKKYTYRFSLAADISFSFTVDDWDDVPVSDGDNTDEDDEIEIY